MQAVIEKSTTYDLSRFDRSLQAAEKTAAKKTKKVAKSRRGVSGFAVLSALVVFVMSTALLLSYVKLTEASEQNRQSLAQVEKLSEDVQMLEIARDQRMGDLQIRDWAVTKLGMSKIDKSQITYVTTASGDRFEHGEEAKETPKVVAGLIKGFSTIVEFVN